MEKLREGRRKEGKVMGWREASHEGVVCGKMEEAGAAAFGTREELVEGPGSRWVRRQAPREVGDEGGRIGSVQGSRPGQG